MPQAGIFIAQFAAGLASVIGPGLTDALFKLAGSLILGYAAQLLRGKPKTPELIRDLQVPETLPPYRFVYGHTRIHGSYAPVLVKGRILYACLILNSRPSEGNFTIFMDKRKMALTGDPFDFSGAGATASEAPFTGHVKAWIGLGDQTTPPEAITDEVPELFETTDGWQGRTVLWLRLDAGDTRSRSERWPRTPPEVEVAGDWSLVWDPRHEAQDPDDPSTWTFSDNQALCTLDALRQNPIRRYQMDSLLLDTFLDAADLADEGVSLKDESIEPRYRVAGVLIFEGAELEDQLGPLIAAGASAFTRVGGKLGLVPGAYVDPSQTLTDLIGDGFEYQRLKRGRDLPTQVRCTYISAARDYEAAELIPWDIPGAQAEDGGVPAILDLRLDMVTSPTQAMRIRKIEGLRARRQRSITGVAPAAAFDLVAGSGVTVAFPAPYAALNGTFEVQSIHPMASPVGDDGGVALRCPVTVLETSADIFAWDAETEEEEVVDPPEFDTAQSSAALPGEITAYTGAAAALDTGNGSIPRLLFKFAPSPSAATVGYEWQYRPDGGNYASGGVIDADVRDGADVFVYVAPVSVGTAYDFRVRTVWGGGASDWQEITGVVATAPDYTLPVPTGSALGGTAKVTVSITTGNSESVTGAELWGSDTSDIEDAVKLGDTHHAGPSTTITVVETGLGPEVTRYYFARSTGPYSTFSTFSLIASATTSSEGP